jgi:hypothetical protein
MRAWFGVFLVLLFVQKAVYSQVPQTLDQLKQLLEISQRRGQLEMDGATPFHLIASYDQFDFGGRPAGKGSIDELWENTKRYRQVLTVPQIEETKSGTVAHFQQMLTLPPRKLTEVDNGTQAWRTGQWVLFADFLGPLLKPFSPLSRVSDKLTNEAPPPGNNGLDCIGTEPDLPGVANDTLLALTTYCLAKGNHLLRFISRPNGVEITFSDVQPFGKKYIARSIQVGVRGKIVLKLHVDLLEGATNSPELDIPAPVTAQLLDYHRADMPLVTGELMGGQLLTKISPQYPQAGLRGTITVKVHVNTTGKVESEDVLDAENQILKAPVLTALKQWQFRVSYQGTKLVPVDHVYKFSYGGEEALQ